MMFIKKPIILDDFCPSAIGDCISSDNYFDNISIRDICYERNLIDQKLKAEARTLSLNGDYLEESSPILKMNNLDLYSGRRSTFYERNQKNRFDEDSFIDILYKNGVKFESKMELNRMLMDIRSKFVWAPGFSLQLGSKGRKIMLQLLRLAYRSNKKYKNIFQNKNPPTTISNLPFFKISMLWELAHDMGVFEHAILIHELFGSFKKKIITVDSYNTHIPQAPIPKYDYRNDIKVSFRDFVNLL